MNIHALIGEQQTTKDGNDGPLGNRCWYYKVIFLTQQLIRVRFQVVHRWLSVTHLFMSEYEVNIYWNVAIICILLRTTEFWKLFSYCTKLAENKRFCGVAPSVCVWSYTYGCARITCYFLKCSKADVRTDYSVTLLNHMVTLSVLPTHAQSNPLA